MITHHARIVWAVTLLFALSPVQSAFAGSPTDQLREGIEQVVKILKDPELRGDKKTDERRAAISKVADKVFDFTETSKRALRQYWAQRTPAEREEFVRLFTELIRRTYLAKVDQYNSEMVFQGETVDGDEAIVRTTLMLGKGGEMSLNYRMHQTRDRWRVYDLDVAGISLVANYRTQFSKIIRTDSYDALLAKLKSHQADLSTTALISSGKAER